MDYARLGHTGLKVSRLCLGGMMLGRWGNTDHDDCGRIVRRAIDEGVNFVDTANRYSMGESEEIIGKALAGRRDEVGLAPVFCLAGVRSCNSRRHVMPGRESPGGSATD
jgi:aryl-alcohol dehydrogenase-like predicted oxidoreductase